MNKRYILMLLLLIQSIAMWAQMEIKGRVLDAATGETLPYAQILTNDGPAVFPKPYRTHKQNEQT